MLPIQQRTGPAPEAVEGIDEAGRKQAFVQPRLALGVPEAIAAPVHSLVNSADATARGEAPTTEDLMRVLLTSALPSLGGKASDEAMMSAGARFTKEVRPPKENIHDVIDSNFSFGGKVLGNKEVDPESLSGGVGPSADDIKRVKALAGKISGPNGYFERLLVDSDGNVIEGQHRLDAAKLLGLKNIPVTVLRDNASGFDTAAMRQAVKDAGVKASDHQNQIVEHALNILHESGGNPQKALEDYELPGFDKAFQAAIRVAKPSGLINRPNITPASIAQEHALDMAAIDRQAMESVAKKNTPEKP